jgi:hypothetical protein
MPLAHARVLLPALGIALAGATLALSCKHAEPPPPAAAAAAAAPSSEPAAPAPAAAPADPLAAFETVRAVLQSPRCVNCHPVGDAPLQGDDGHVHHQNVRRGTDGRGVAGLECAACHGKANLPASYGTHTPPGVSTGWSLPPAHTKMVFQGLDSAALCEQLKDPERNGGHDLASLVQHVSADPLVLWGWSPGPGRAPVAIAHAEFVAAFKAWADRGAPCPARR